MGEKERIRSLFWGLVQTDCLFRLFYDKPSVIKGSTDQVHLPSSVFPVSAPSRSQPKAAQSIVNIVWTRIMFITNGFVDFMDNQSCDQRQQPDTLQSQVNYYCDQIKELVNDWAIVSNEP